MRIYVAASFTAQRRLRVIREHLFQQGHMICGTWLDEVTKPEVLSKEQFDKRLASKDLQEIREADCFILDTEEESTTGGRYVELGFALAHMKLLYVVGSPNCIFAHLADQRFATWEECLEHIKTEHPARPYIATGMENKIFTGHSPVIEPVIDNNPTVLYGIMVHDMNNPDHSSWYCRDHGPVRTFWTKEDAELFINSSPNILFFQTRGTTYEVRPYTGSK